MVRGTNMLGGNNSIAFKGARGNFVKGARGNFDPLLKVFCPTSQMSAFLFIHVPLDINICPPLSQSLN